MFRSTDLASRRHEAGFTLVEVLVALGVVAVSLAAIGSLVATNINATRALEQRIALLETTRAIITGMPSRAQLVPGNMTGDYAGYRWRLDVQPFAANFVDPSLPSPWYPQTVIMRVQAPGGQILRIDTARLRRREGR